VIGAGGTGKTHRLQTWADELAADLDARVTWLTGNPLRPVDAPQLTQALEATAGNAGDNAPPVLALDDLHWFDPDALEALIEALTSIVPDGQRPPTVLASHRPSTDDREVQDRLDVVDDLLTGATAATRTGLLDIDAFAPALSSLRAQAGAGGGAMSSDLVTAVHDRCAGSVGLAADLVAGGWSPETDVLPAEVADAVIRRVRRAGHHAGELVTLWAVAVSLPEAGHDALPLALAALDGETAQDGSEIDAGSAERAARAGGLVTDDDRLIPLVAEAVLSDLARADRGARHDRLAAHLAPTDTVAAARHLLAGTGAVDGAPQLLSTAALALAGTAPDEAHTMLDRAADLGLQTGELALIRGLIAFHAGAPEALGHLDRLQQATGGALDERAALLSFGLDLRELRFDSAANRPVQGELAEPLRNLASALVGRIGEDDDTGNDQSDGEPSPALTPIGRLAHAMAEAVVSLARGEASDSLGSLATAADDFDRLRPTIPFGITPHGLGALTAIVVGDLTAADLLCTQGLTQASGGPGERLTHELVQAYGQLLDGDYAQTLGLLRLHTDTYGDDPDAPTGPGPRDQTLSQRDRLLLAGLEAAVARRSGDTGRLRAAWARAEQALIRQSASWVLADLFAELLACGARLGDDRRVEAVLGPVLAQATALPAEGPGPVTGHWLRLQIALAADDHAAVAAEAEAVAALDPADTRSRARVAAAQAWAAVMGGTATEALVVEAAERLSAVGDGWEASRLLGQAALDEDDPKAARRMLELARLATSEQVDDTPGEGLEALGLSDREAEVAVLVADGRTHKEIGAQLFISPKTVEHHVAKIRQKLGATSRADLLGIIRDAVGQA
jgi:DNA-binding NarL/FixJ family response regulator